MSGMNLEVALEMSTQAVAWTGTGLKPMKRSFLPITDTDYDGCTGTCYLEVVATNGDATPHNIYLVNYTDDPTGASPIVTLQMDASLSNQRIRSSGFSLVSGTKTYALFTDDGTAACTIWTSTVLIKQVNATKTRLQFLLGAHLGTSTTEAAVGNGAWSSTKSDTYVQGTPAYHDIFLKDNANLATLAASNPWSFEVLGAASSTTAVYCALVQAGTTTVVTGTEMTWNSTTHAVQSVDLANNAENFTDDSLFEVVGKGVNASSKYVYVFRAAMYVRLVNLDVIGAKVAVFQRLAQSVSATAAGAQTNGRRLYTAANWNNPTVYMEATGSCADNAEALHLRSQVSADTGTTSTTDVEPGINWNSATKARTRTGAVAVTDTYRYTINNLATTGTHAHSSVFLVFVQTNTGAAARLRPGKFQF